ncbi:MAG TPA: hypothetical protein VF796_15915 [Humisphaera sp.]
MTTTATAALSDDALQDLCERGSELLVRTEYLEAERALAAAEAAAYAARDWDTLARVYMPLQEARRQRRQRCGEGSVRLDLVSPVPGEGVDAEQVLREHPHGQLLVAGWGTAAPAAEVRRLAAERGLYVETFLAAVYPVADDAVPPAPAERVVVIVPSADTPLPDPTPRPRVDLYAMLDPDCLAVPLADLPGGVRKGTTATFAEVMALWERLHRPFLARADAEPDAAARVDRYRATIGVDYACEFAHQRLSETARRLANARS